MKVKRKGTFTIKGMTVQDAQNICDLADNLTTDEIQISLQCSRKDAMSIERTIEEMRDAIMNRNEKQGG